MDASATDDSDDRGGSEVIVQLVLRPGERMRGRLDAPGQASSATFDGWIDLMGAVNSLREDFGLTASSSPTPGSINSASAIADDAKDQGFP